KNDALQRAGRLGLGTLALVLFILDVSGPALGATADDAQAGVVLRSLAVGIPSANCPTVGPALALVQTSKMNVPQSVINGVPLLLVTSCWSSKVSDRSVLYFLNP